MSESNQSPLFYERVRILDRVADRELRLMPPRDFRFAAEPLRSHWRRKNFSPLRRRVSSSSLTPNPTVLFVSIQSPLRHARKGFEYRGPMFNRVQWRGIQCGNRQ